MGEEMEPWGVGRARSQAVVILSFCWLRQTGLAFLCLYSPRCCTVLYCTVLYCTVL